MGTNFDWYNRPGIPDTHIGKKSMVMDEASGKVVGQFTWAADPVQALYLLNAFAHERCVTDEYGEVITGERMLGIITGCQRQDYSSVGLDFS